MLDALAHVVYLLAHKWAVYQEGVQLGVPRRQLLVHDLSKFSRSEFWGYTRWFYGGVAASNTWQHFGFKRAWAHHWQTNPHHWEHWCHREVLGLVIEIEPRPMPDVYIREMLADWRGAARTKDSWATWRQTRNGGGAVDVPTFYRTRGPSMRLHPQTRRALEDLLGLEFAYNPDGPP